MTASTWDVDGAVCLYADGRTLKQSPDDFGIAATTVRTHLIKRGVELRRAGCGPRRDVDSAQIRWMRNVEGATWVEIAESVGMTLPGARSRNLADQPSATTDLDFWAQVFRAALDRHPVIDVANGVERYLGRVPTRSELTASLRATIEIESAGSGKRTATVLGRPQVSGRQQRLLLIRTDATDQQVRSFASRRP